MEPPSREILMRLNDLARRGNIRAIGEEAVQLTQHPVFADQLKKLCKGFKIKELKELIGSAVAESERASDAEEEVGAES